MLVHAGSAHHKQSSVEKKKKEKKEKERWVVQEDQCLDLGLYQSSRVAIEGAFPAGIVLSVLVKN